MSELVKALLSAALKSVTIAEAMPERAEDSIITIKYAISGLKGIARRALRLSKAQPSKADVFSEDAKAAEDAIEKAKTALARISPVHKHQAKRLRLMAEIEEEEEGDEEEKCNDHNH
jgi:hypothetical protein